MNSLFFGGGWVVGWGGDLTSRYRSTKILGRGMVLREDGWHQNGIKGSKEDQLERWIIKGKTRSPRIDNFLEICKCL